MFLKKKKTVQSKKISQITTDLINAKKFLQLQLFVMLLVMIIKI